jgi:hypothetical protein
LVTPAVKGDNSIGLVTDNMMGNAEV